MNAFEKANKKAWEMGGKLIAFAVEKNSTYIYQCIVEFNDKYDKYTVWLYNAEFDGFYNGTYTANIEYAYSEFATRLQR